MKTVKPGADLDVSALVDGPLNVGAYTDVIVRVTPGYTSGRLVGEASGTEGLEILASSATLSHDLSTGDAVWRVSVRPLSDERHYLNVLARVSGGTLNEATARSFAFAIDPGEPSSSKPSSNTPTLIKSDDENLAVFQPDETITPN